MRFEKFGVVKLYIYLYGAGLGKFQALSNPEEVYTDYKIFLFVRPRIAWLSNQYEKTIGKKVLMDIISNVNSITKFY